MNNLQTTAESIRKIRDEVKMTQAQFAQELGVRQATVSDWETGARVPSRLAIHALCHMRDRFDSSRLLHRARVAEAELERGEHIRVLRKLYTALNSFLADNSHTIRSDEVVILDAIREAKETIEKANK